jgi:hypothetical protein
MRAALSMCAAVAAPATIADARPSAAAVHATPPTPAARDAAIIEAGKKGVRDKLKDPDSANFRSL